jgi:predicted nucleic acid-binding protein
VNADVNLVFEALKRSKKHALGFIDLLHYTTAILHNCEAIASFDKDFDGLEIKRIT